MITGVWYLEVEGNNSRGIDPRKCIMVTTQNANLYINQMAFKQVYAWLGKLFGSKYN